MGLDDKTVPPSITRVSRWLKEYGEKQHIPVLTEPEFLPSDFETTGNAIATVASGLLERFSTIEPPLTTAPCTCSSRRTK